MKTTIYRIMPCEVDYDYSPGQQEKVGRERQITQQHEPASVTINEVKIHGVVIPINAEDNESIQEIILIRAEVWESQMEGSMDLAEKLCPPQNS